MMTMTVAELMQSLMGAGVPMGVGIVALPLVLGAAAALAARFGQRALSQRIANASIGLALFALLVVGLWTAYATTVPGLIAQTQVVVFVAPIYLIGTSFVIEHRLHPEQQDDVRKRIRHVLLLLAGLGVVYFVFSRLSFHMLIWTNVVGFVFFVVVLIAILYVLIRKVV